VKANNIKALLDWMAAEFTSDRRIDYNAASLNNYLNQDFVWQQQKQRWLNHANELLSDSLDKVIQVKEDWDRDACGLGLPGVEAAEMLHHYAWAASKISDFVGREKLLKQAMELLEPSDLTLSERALVFEDDADRDDENKFRSQQSSKKKSQRALSPPPQQLQHPQSFFDILGFGCCTSAAAYQLKQSKIGIGEALRRARSFYAVSFYLCGESGSGKTAAMAKIAQGCYEFQSSSPNEEIRNRPIIVRFCGTSPGSSNGLSLVQSICRQIHFILGHDMSVSPASDVLKMGYDEAVKHLHGLLKDTPVVLIIDSLDQLSNEHLARSNISFLKGLEPHPLTRIVLSTLPDEKDEGAYVCMFVRVCMCVCMCVYVCMCVLVCVCMCVYDCVCVYECVCVCLYVYMCVYVVVLM
jgi:hypothetical protein